MPKPSRSSVSLKRKACPRLLSFIEKKLARYEKKKEAAEALGISPTELTFIGQGTRIPSPDTILALLTLKPRGQENESQGQDFAGELDQLLIYGGYSPLFYKHIVPTDQRLLVLAKGERGYALCLSDEPQPDLANLRFACLQSGACLVRIDDAQASDLPRQYLLVEPISAETELSDGDIVIYGVGDGEVFFRRFERDRESASLPPVDLATLRDEVQSQTVPEPLQPLNLRGRILLKFTPPELPSTAQSTRRPRRGVSRLDRLQVGVSPFQDALLLTIGAELGFYEQEGLLVDCVPVDWYQWQSFFGDSSDRRIVFTNIFSFVREYAEHQDLAFLYAVNVFNQGFALLAKDNSLRSAQELALELQDRNEICRKVLEQLDDAPIGTISESDWAAQIFTLCQTLGINMKVQVGPFQHQLLPQPPEKGHGRTTLSIVDPGSRLLGVVNSPAAIHETQKFYFGSLPQRTRLKYDYHWKEILTPEYIPKPFPINGFVGRQDIYEQQDILLRFLRVWFRIISYIRPEVESTDPNVVPAAHSGSRIVQRSFDEYLFPKDVAKLNIFLTGNERRNEVVETWRLEQFPPTPFEVKRTILRGDSEAPPWKLDAVRAINYLQALFAAGGEQTARKKAWRALAAEVGDNKAKKRTRAAFLLDDVQDKYTTLYGSGEHIRDSLNAEPIPEQVAALRRQ